MTVELLQLDFAYSGNGSQVAFPTPFFTADADIVATLRQVAGPATELELGIQYTLTGAGNPLGGTLTIIDPGVVPGAIGMLVITTNAPNNQQRNYPRVGSIDNKEYERSVDRRTLLSQQNARRIERSLRAPDVDLAGDMVLPLEYLRANRILAFDGTGLPDCLSYEELSDLLLPFFTGAAARSGMLTIEELGVTGDGVTDETPALNAAADLWSARGGATFFLRAKPDGGFRLNSPFNLRSGINVIFGNGPVILGGTGCIRMAGDASVQEVAYVISTPALAGANQLFVDPSAGGSGDVQHFFPAGTRIVIAGNVNNAELQVVGSDQFRITISPNLPFNTDASDRIRIIDQSQLTSDVAKGTATVPVASTIPFSVRDWVMIEDDMTCGDVVAGANHAARVHCEIAQVIGVGALTLTLDRNLQHDFKTAFLGRVVRLEPVKRASVSGASVRYAGNLTIPATFDMIRAVNCEMVDCECPNDDPSFGATGASFRFYQSCDSRYVRPVGRNPQSSLPEVHGCEARLSSGCTFVDPDMSGYRHNLVFRESATGCHATGAMLDNDQYTSVLYYGADEAGCTVSLRAIGGGSLVASGVSKKIALQFGLDDGLVGPSNCVVEDGKLSQYPDTAIRFVPGALDCRVKVGASDIGTLLWHEDSPVNGTIAAKGCEVDCTVDRWAGRLVDIQGTLHGAPVNTMKDLSLHVRASGGSKYISMSGFDGADVHVELTKGSVDVSEPFAINAVGGTGLSIKRCDIADVRSGISLTNCPAAVVVFNAFERFSGGTVWFNDGGGNTNATLAMNIQAGFVGTKTVSGTPSTGITDQLYVGIT